MRLAEGECEGALLTARPFSHPLHVGKKETVNLFCDKIINSKQALLLSMAHLVLKSHTLQRKRRIHSTPMESVVSGSRLCSLQ